MIPRDVNSAELELNPPFTLSVELLRGTDDVNDEHRISLGHGVLKVLGHPTK